MATKKLASIKGRRMRITRENECGDPVVGSCSTVVTDGFITVEITEEVEAGDEYTQKNAWGEFCVNEKDPDVTKWVNVAITLCNVDPDVLDIAVNANPALFPAVTPDTIGVSFGGNVNDQAFGIEVWTKAAGQDACAAGTVEWGYFVVPFLKNGRINGALTIGNSVMNVGVVAQGQKATADWGVGPYGDNPWLVTTGFPVGDFFGAVRTTVQPPAVTAGCQALA